jgi:hypothetical protein
VHLDTTWSGCNHQRHHRRLTRSVCLQQRIIDDTKNFTHTTKTKRNGRLHAFNLLQQRAISSSLCSREHEHMLITCCNIVKTRLRESNDRDCSLLRDVFHYIQSTRVLVNTQLFTICNCGLLEKITRFLFLTIYSYRPTYSYIFPGKRQRAAAIPIHIQSLHPSWMLPSASAADQTAAASAACYLKPRASLCGLEQEFSFAGERH